MFFSETDLSDFIEENDVKFYRLLPLFYNTYIVSLKGCRCQKFFGAASNFVKYIPWCRLVICIQ